MNLLNFIDPMAINIRRRKLVIETANRVEKWTDWPNGQIHDPYETEDGEGFGPALMSIIYAKCWQWTGNKRYFNFAYLSIHRSLNILARRVRYRNRLTDLFLAHYSLHAYALVKNSISKKSNQSFISRFNDIDLLYQHNSNGLALTIAWQLNRDTLNIRNCDLNLLTKLAQTLKSQQHASGFIDDGINTNQKPIAYHLLIWLIISQCLALRQSKPEKWEATNFQTLRKILISLIEDEKSWLLNFVALDGSLSMTERSSNHIWTSGAFIAWLQSHEMSNQNLLIKNHLDYWKKITTPDGVVNNKLPHEIRCGYEDYANTVQYIPLGSAYLALAEDPHFYKSSTLKDKPLLFIDKQSGYAHHSGYHASFGISLNQKTDSQDGGYCLPGSLFNYCHANSTHKILATSTSRPNNWCLKNRREATCHEGIILTTKNKKTLWPDSAVIDINVKQNQTTISHKIINTEVTRKIVNSDSSFLSEWTIFSNESYLTFEASIPLIYDSKQVPRTFQVTENTANVLENGRIIARVVANTLLGIDIGINTQSTSGLVKSLRMRYPGNVKSGTPMTLTYRLDFNDFSKPKCKKILFDDSLQTDMHWRENDKEKIIHNRATIEWDLKDKDSAYYLSGGPFKNFRSIPTFPFKFKKHDSGYYIEINCTIWNVINRSSVEAIWFLYDEKGFSYSSCFFPLFDGRNIIPLTDRDRHTARIGLRITGKGKIKLSSIKVFTIT